MAETRAETKAASRAANQAEGQAEIRAEIRAERRVEPRASPPRLLLRAAAALGLVAGIALLARFPIAGAGEAAAIRLAVRTATAKVETCRPATPAELAAQPIHMRTEQICREVMPDYRLTLAIDGAAVLDRRLVPQGVRRTRPLSFDASVPITPGRHHLAVDLAPADPASLDVAALADLPASHLERDVEVAAGRQILVLLDADGELAILDRAP